MRIHDLPPDLLVLQSAKTNLAAIRAESWLTDLIELGPRRVTKDD